MEKLLNSLLIGLGSECGVVSIVLIGACAFLGSLWWLERADRRAAWKARNQDLEAQLKTLNELKVLLQIIKTLMEK